MYTDSELANFPEEPLLALEKIIKDHRSVIEAEGRISLKQYDLIALAYIFLRETEIDIDEPELVGDPKADWENIASWFQRLSGIIDADIKSLKSAEIRNEIEERSNRYSAFFRKGFYYTFTDPDLKRIQSLITELRALIAETADLEESHRQRLLRRLEKLQSELHKRVSDLDRFWGLVGDAGVVLGKLGRDAKPIVDRIREIAELTWRTQARSEELPSDARFPRLESGADPE